MTARIMLYRRLGRTNLRVSELSFGAARGAKTDKRGFIDTIKTSIDAGINFFDTAEGYEAGESEKALGEALSGNPDLLVETKYCPYDSYRPGASYTGNPRRLIEAAEGSLRRLKRDRLDIFLGHGIRSLETLDRFMHDGCYDAMVKLRDQGKVRFIGISELSEVDGNHEVLLNVVPTGAFDVVMLTINFLLQTASEKLIPLCVANDVGTVVMMPLNQASKESGLVSKPAALECVRRHVEQGNLPPNDPYTDADLFDFLQPYSIPEAGLRFVLSHEVGTCCVGMRSRERLSQNLKALDPPYLDQGRLTKLCEYFDGIQRQVK